jgi:hypothetical protein
MQGLIGSTKPLLHSPGKGQNLLPNLGLEGRLFSRAVRKLIFYRLNYLDLRVTALKDIYLDVLSHLFLGIKSSLFSNDRCFFLRLEWYEVGNTTILRKISDECIEIFLNNFLNTS